ncbi:MAG TPA: flagellar biosynthetic protein FlhB [Clostridiaceae bacterium]|nr:flagellar biosynthetic protein FlhB [Clostridiaceae bacterium]
MQYNDVIIFCLVFVRIISFLGVSPLFMVKGLTNIVKISLGLVLSLMISGFVVYNPAALPSSIWELVFDAAGECMFGLALGFMTTLVFQAIKMSGQFMDLQVGFSMASLYDATSNSNVTILGNLTNLIGLLVFFLINGHHVLIESLIRSFDIVPIFGLNIPESVSTYVLQVFGNMLVLSVKLAAPVMIVIFITDFTLGLISRTVPQLNILMLSLPLKLTVGLAVFSLILPGLLHIYIKAMEGIPQDINNFLRLFPLVILFASEDRTEEPTFRKKEEARKKGQVPKSREFVSAVTLIGITIMMTSFGKYLLDNLEKLLIKSFNSIEGFAASQGNIANLFLYIVLEFLKITLPFMVGVMVLGIAANVVQTGFIHTTEPFKAKLSRINPIQGFKRMFSGRTAIELLKSIANILIVGYVAYSFIKTQIYRILQVSDMSIPSLAAVWGDLIKNELLKVSIVVAVIGIADLIYQRRAYNKELMMTKQEVKEEYKQMEGDPQIKSAIRQKQRQVAARRMMQEVPKATVVITNPTHLAVALKYERGQDSAPICVAKGADNVANRIKQIAKESNVPIIENKPVARMLYQKVDINEAIPVELYQAVAEILAVVYSLNKKSRG